LGQERSNKCRDKNHENEFLGLKAKLALNLPRSLLMRQRAELLGSHCSILCADMELLSRYFWSIWSGWDVDMKTREYRDTTDGERWIFWSNGSVLDFSVGAGITP
jgi:hypothetical protein